LIKARDEAVLERQKLAFAGIISIGMAITARGELAGDPDVVYSGIPAKTRSGQPVAEIIDQALFTTFESLPKARKRDADGVAQSIEKAVRHCLRDEWGKRPMVHVLVMQV
jgi:ribonuclease J